MYYQTDYNFKSRKQKNNNLIKRVVIYDFFLALDFHKSVIEFVCKFKGFSFKAGFVKGFVFKKKDL